LVVLYIHYIHVISNCITPVVSSSLTKNVINGYCIHIPEIEDMCTPHKNSIIKPHFNYASDFEMCPALFTFPNFDLGVTLKGF
jgi:hypothetical protein